MDTQKRLARAEELLLSISNWLVCEAIGTPEDMVQSFTEFREEIDSFLNENLRNGCCIYCFSTCCKGECQNESNS